MFSGEEDQLFPIFDQDEEYLNDPFQTTQSSFMCGAMQTPAVQQQADDLTTTSMRKNPRKDKHRKIVTAKGPRDRRMRLSLDVAKRFFDLQDVLGFDKASKTVDWLISKSTEAIKSVTGWGGSMTSSQPESRRRSSYIADRHDVSTSSEIRRKAKAKEKMKMKMKTTDPKLVKESRKKARERARERTMEKKMLLLQQQQNPFNFYHKC